MIMNDQFLITGSECSSIAIGNISCNPLKANCYLIIKLIGKIS